MLMEVKLYGKETSPFQYVKHLLQSMHERYPHQFNIAEISDLEKIISDGIKYIPSISINGDVIAYNPNEDSSLESFAKKAINHLLKETNYGQMKKILVPTDFSDCSINAFRYAKSIANSLEDSMIELVHVDHPTPVAVDGELVASYYNEDDKRDKLTALATPLTNDINSDVMKTPLKTTYTKGMTCETLVDMSEEVDLIVIGTHGKGNILSQLLGSVSRTIVSKAKCPVLLIPSDYDYKPIDEIVYGYAPSLHDSEYISKAVEWAKNLGARLDLVHVRKKLDDTDPTLGAQQYIDLKFPDLNYTSRNIESKDVESGLLHVAREQNAGLIILAKQEKTLWQYLTTEHHTNDMLELTDRPILVLHKEVRKCKCGGICKKKPEDQCDH